MKQSSQNLVTEIPQIRVSKDDSALTTSLTATPSFTRQWKRQQPKELKLLNLRLKEKTVCEICENWAILQCASCRSTYYCSMKHLETDEELHKDVCELMKELRAPIEFSACPATRERMKAQYLLRADGLYQYTLLRARSAMLKDLFELGIAASRSSLKAAKVAHGDTAHSILPLTVLTECYLRKKQLQKAQHCLANCLKLEIAFQDTSSAIKAAIRRVEGMVRFQNQDYIVAKHCFAEQIYLYTELLNADHISTASGYMNLGIIFVKMRRQLTARSLFRRTIDIWSMFVSHLLEQQISEASANKLVGDDFIRVDPGSDFSQMGVRPESFFKKMQDKCDRAEAVSGSHYCYLMLTKLDQDIVKADDYIEIEYIQAGLEFINKDYKKARNKFVEAANKCSLQGLTDKPVYQRLKKYRRECDLQIRALKKKVGPQSRGPSISESLVQISA